MLVIAELRLTGRIALYVDPHRFGVYYWYTSPDLGQSGLYQPLGRVCELMWEPVLAEEEVEEVEGVLSPTSLTLVFVFHVVMLRNSLGTNRVRTSTLVLVR